MKHSPAMPTPAAPQATLRPEPDRSALPATTGTVMPGVAAVSLLAHGALFVAAAWLPPPTAGAVASPLLVELELNEPEAPPQAAAMPEPEPEPEPAPPQPRRVVRRPVPPAPPPPILTASAESESGWSHPEGDPAGQLDGVVGGVAGGQGAGIEATPPPPPGPTREELRRMLAQYVTRVLGGYVSGRIQYPMVARREHLEGIVVLRMRVDESGEILGVRVSRSSGHAVLDESALATVLGLDTVPAPPPELPWDDGREWPVPVSFDLQ